MEITTAHCFLYFINICVPNLPQQLSFPLKTNPYTHPNHHHFRKNNRKTPSQPSSPPINNPSLPHNTGKTRTKDKYRVVYSEVQKVELEKEFLYNQYITIQRKSELASFIGLSDRQVCVLLLFSVFFL